MRADQLVELAVESALRCGDVTEADLLDLLGRCGWRRAGSVMLQEVLERRPYAAPPTGSYKEFRSFEVDQVEQALRSAAPASVSRSR
ncbi:MAG: hypothetical protein ACKV2O_04505 [Acidimicrobiales bacterium]